MKVLDAGDADVEREEQVEAAASTGRSDRRA